MIVAILYRQSSVSLLLYNAYDGHIRVEKLRRGGVPMVVDRASWSDSLIMERAIPAFTRWTQQQQAEFAVAADALREMEANRHHQKQLKQLRHPIFISSTAVTNNTKPNPSDPHLVVSTWYVFLLDPRGWCLLARVSSVVQKSESTHTAGSHGHRSDCR
jgi:hypothetical protein